MAKHRRHRRHLRGGPYTKNPSTQTLLIVGAAVAVGVGIYVYTRPAKAATPATPATPGVLPAGPITTLPGMPPGVPVPPAILAWLNNTAIPEACRAKFGAMVPIIQTGILAQKACEAAPGSAACSQMQAGMDQLTKLNADYQATCAQYVPPEG